jgi:AP-3 complex subunit mu
VELFWEEVSKRTKRDVRSSALLSALHPPYPCLTCCTLLQDVPPILVTPKYYLLNIYRGGLYIVSVVTGELAPLSGVEFLHRVFDVLQDYFGEVSPRTLTENFSTVYQLLEEMLDNGHPMITEPNALSSLISPPSIVGRVTSFIVGKTSNVSDTLGESAMSIIPWRRTGVRYAQNEIYFDIIEEIDAIFERYGAPNVGYIYMML